MAGIAQCKCLGTRPGPALQTHITPSCRRPLHARHVGLLHAARSDQEGADAAGKQLAAEFASYTQRTGVTAPHQVQGPSPLLPPHQVVAAQLEALHRNDWPYEDSGASLAFSFALPEGLQHASEGQVPVRTGRSRAWSAAEAWLTPAEFRAMLHSAPYSVMLGCDKWQHTKVASPLKFTGSSQTSSRAVQVVHVEAPGVQHGEGGPLRRYTFSFCLLRIEHGPSKGIWYTTGVRVGDYSG